MCTNELTVKILELRELQDPHQKEAKNGGEAIRSALNANTCAQEEIRAGVYPVTRKTNKAATLDSVGLRKALPEVATRLKRPTSKIQREQKEVISMSGGNDDEYWIALFRQLSEENKETIISSSDALAAV